MQSHKSFAIHTLKFYTAEVLQRREEPSAYSYQTGINPSYPSLAKLPRYYAVSKLYIGNRQLSRKHFQYRFAIELCEPHFLFMSLKYFGSFLRPRYLAFCFTMPFDIPRRWAISALGVLGYKSLKSFLSSTKFIAIIIKNECLFWHSFSGTLTDLWSDTCSVSCNFLIRSWAA